MGFTLKLIPKGIKRKKNYNIVVVAQRVGFSGKALGYIGYYELKGSDKGLFVVNKKVLRLWLTRGLKVPKSLKKIINLV